MAQNQLFKEFRGLKEHFEVGCMPPFCESKAVFSALQANLCSIANRVPFFCFSVSSLQANQCSTANRASFFCFSTCLSISILSILKNFKIISSVSKSISNYTHTHTHKYLIHVSVCIYKYIYIYVYIFLFIYFFLQLY